MNTGMWLFAAFFAVVMGSIAIVGWVMLRRQEGADSAGDGELSAGGFPPPGSRKILARALHKVGEAVPGANRESESVRRKLLMAGYRWPSAITIFHGAKVAAGLGAAGLTGWTMMFLSGEGGSTLLPALCVGGVGFLLPDRLLDAYVRNRSQKIRSALAPAIDLLVLAVEAGQSLDQAMLDVAKSLAGPYPELSDEFLFFHLEVRAGKSREDALRGLGLRSSEPEMRKLVAVLLDGDRFGASLGPALRTHARYLRTRIRQQAQERARKLTVQLVLPTFFLIFPAVLAVTLGPAYLQLRDSLGRLMNGL